MYKIVKKKELTPDIIQYLVEAPLIAKKAKAGQFVVIRVNENGERVPLTISSYQHDKGIISLVAMRVGKSTALLSELEEGDSILDVVGPLGNPSEIENFGRVICVGGGVGVAVVLPIAVELKKAGNYVISIMGAKTEKVLILEKEMKEASDELYICTDDGSRGYHGFVSGFLEEYLSRHLANRENKKHGIDRVVAIGPALMMAAVARVTEQYRIKTIVSLNSIMVDGTGMCGACRVEVGGKTKFVCVDGPEFDAHEVNFDLLVSRQKIYCDQESACYDLYKKDCKCKK
ncbi:MAG: sulfide/dihydroorotate dehydrogenase-like FAD/NAD-binding protein [Actinobacteria bacterium]|nr:sulfide/dihydroorotate dehydrogenase-like FAD/NAD-binding protein [Actinomycetota bacterium]